MTLQNNLSKPFKRENGEVVINCISEFPDSAEMNTAPGPFTIKANADGNLENQLGTELGPGQISAFIAAQVVGDNRFGKQMRAGFFIVIKMSDLF